MEKEKRKEVMSIAEWKNNRINERLIWRMGEVGVRCRRFESGIFWFV